MKEQMPLSWVEIDLDAIAHNIRQIRGIIQPTTKLMVVVKGNATSHGVVEVGRVAVENGAEMLGVTSLDEAFELREAGIGCPILNLSYSPEENADEVIRLNLSQTVYSLSHVRALSDAALRQDKTALAHVKVDTGLSRIGVLPDEAVAFVEQALRFPNIRIEGIFTHFADAANVDSSFTQLQHRAFQKVVDDLQARGIEIPLKHVASSAIIPNLPELHLDLVRVGTSVFGIDFNQPRNSRLNLRQTLQFKTRVVQVKDLPAGATVGYRRACVLKRPSRIATLPVGFFDGLDLLTQGKEVLVREKRAPIAGIVSMNLCMVDVTDIPGASVGDEIVIIGSQGGEAITWRDYVGKLKTLFGEPLCMISLRVPRIYLKGGIKYKAVTWYPKEVPIELPGSVNG